MVPARSARRSRRPRGCRLLRFLRRLACAGTVAAGRARCSSGEGRCADPFNVHCTKSLRCDLPKPGLAAFGMDSARTKTHGRATVACQKGGMYPTFDSAAGSGEIPVFFGILPDLILRVTWFDSASGPIPVNVPHCGALASSMRALSHVSTFKNHTKRIRLRSLSSLSLRPGPSLLPSYGTVR